MCDVSSRLKKSNRLSPKYVSLRLCSLRPAKECGHLTKRGRKLCPYCRKSAKKWLTVVCAACAGVFKCNLWDVSRKKHARKRVTENGYQIDRKEIKHIYGKAALQQKINCLEIACLRTNGVAKYLKEIVLHARIAVSTLGSCAQITSNHGVDFLIYVSIYPTAELFAGHVIEKPLPLALSPLPRNARKGNSK